uniref:Uncharacterized protein n=1 Tax=Romanomermis culicivorax TaxID=13658 RepID=A0A915I725_ROMCU
MSKIIQVVKPHIPSIRFPPHRAQPKFVPGVTFNIAQDSSSRSASNSTSTKPGSIISRTLVETVPPHFLRRKILSREEIDAINTGATGNAEGSDRLVSLT